MSRNQIVIVKIRRLTDEKEISLSPPLSLRPINTLLIYEKSDQTKECLMLHEDIAVNIIYFSPRN